MEKIYLVFDEFIENRTEQCVDIIPCATMDIAIKVLKRRYEWYIIESCFQVFVEQCEDGRLCPRKELLGKNDLWEVDEDSVEILISDKGIRLNLHIAEEPVVCE